MHLLQCTSEKSFNMPCIPYPVWHCRFNDSWALCRLWVLAIWYRPIVMSENALDCTQNAAYRDRKFKKILGRGQAPFPDPFPIEEGDTFSPNLLDSRAFGARPAACPLSPFAPPPSHTSGYGPAKILRSRYYSTSYNSKMVQYRAIFTMVDQ